MITGTTVKSMSTGLLKVAERAADPRAVMRSVARRIDVKALAGAFERLRSRAAVGVDGVSKDDYGQKLAENLNDLHERLRSHQYRHQPLLRVHIPKEDGKTRPIGISCTEDKIVQSALHELLEVIYEPVFLGTSYGYRPGVGAHDALRALDRVSVRGELRWVYEADIRSYFDSIDRKKLMEMLRERVDDDDLLRLVGKCLHVGILDGNEYSEPEVGTPQGSVLSPILGNIYLHHVLDRWFEEEVKPRLKGKAVLVRFADDFVIGLEREDDARRVADVMPRRFARYGLTLHPEKTRLLDFRRPKLTQRHGKGSSTLDFLGFTLFWRKSRKGTWVLGLRTRKSRLQRAITRAAEWCRRHRHLPVKEQQDRLSRLLVGHYNYFGVNGNFAALDRLYHAARSNWRKWLDRRSQRGRMPWKRFLQLLERHPIPSPSVRVDIWKPKPQA
jgi:group II intron reverse transcriptase/maturase